MLIHRYITKEILQTFFAVLLVVLLIFLGRYFSRFLADAAAGELSGTIIMDMLILRTLAGVGDLMLFSLYLAVLLTFGRLYKDNEMTALSSSGVSIGQIAWMVFVVAIGFATVIATFSLWLSPLANQKAIEIQKLAQRTSPLEGLVPGQFNQLGRGKLVFYVENISADGNTLNNVFVQHQTEQQSTDVFSAEKAFQHVDQQTGERYLILVNGYQYQGTVGEAQFKVHRYERNAIRLEQQEDRDLKLRPRTMSLDRLWESGGAKEMVELSSRVNVIVTAVLLPLLGLLLSKTTPRQGRFARVFIAILAYAIYVNLLNISRAWIEQGKLPLWLGASWVQLATITLILIMLYRQLGSARTRAES